MHKKGFTLVEIIIVIVIIWILMAIGLGVNRGSIEKMKAKTATEQVTTIFDTVFLQVQASNYQMWNPYTGISLTLSWGANSVSYVYEIDQTRVPDAQNIERTANWDFSISTITTTWDFRNPQPENKLDAVTIYYIPFLTTCEIKDSSNKDYNKIYFSVRPKGYKEACFSLNSKYCKLLAISCNDD